MAGRPMHPSPEGLAAAWRAAADLSATPPAAATEHAPLPTDRLWTQLEAAYYLGVSVRYLRQSNCTKLLLPGTGAKQQPLLRYEPQTVKAWAAAWRSGSLRRAS